MYFEQIAFSRKRIVPLGGQENIGPIYSCDIVHEVM